jgi:hypothetical protein
MTRNRLRVLALLALTTLALGRCQQVLGLDPPSLLDASSGTLDCPAGFESCGGKLCDTDTTKDPNNCGACGWVCPSNNTPAACVAGQCHVTCANGFVDCN